MTKTTYILQMPQEIKKKIMDELELILSGEDLRIAIYSRLVDLEEIININKYL